MKPAGTITLLIFIFTVQNVSALAQSCPESLTRTTDGTNRFIGYLGHLLEGQIIGDRELSRLIDSLEKGILENPIRGEDAQISSKLQIHRKGLEKLIRTSQMDQEKILEWARSHLKEKDRVRVRREETLAETQLTHVQMEFNPVDTGDYRRFNVVIGNPFEMMSTPVTQKQWSVIMGNNPSKFINGEETIIMTVDGKVIKMQPDNPVEQVSWNDVQQYIKRLNELSDSNDPKLYQLISSHQKGDHYRLPIKGEWMLVILNRGRPAGRYFFGDNEDAVKDHAWYRVNAADSTHPVARLTPLIVDGYKFFDMIGNVWEWTQETSSFDERFVVGGSYNSVRHNLASQDVWQSLNKHKVSSEVGFRLVRFRP